jgi:hypothetical protein
MTISGLQIVVRGPASLRALDAGGREWPTSVRQNISVDWRALRSRLIELKCGDPSAVAGWLEYAGYVARIRAFNPLNENAADEKIWTVEYVTPAISAWLRRRKDVILALMTVERDVFLGAIDAVVRYPRKTDIGADEVAFKRALERFIDVSNLDAQVLFQFLAGAGMAPYLHAGFNWGPEGRPAVTVFTDSPMEAIGISIHIDRNFSARQWVECAKASCPNSFERKKSSERYCSDRCADYVTTNKRRSKIKLLKQADQAWEELPWAKRKSQNHLQWVAKWVRRQSQGGFKIQPTWARSELTKEKEGTIKNTVHRKAAPC